MMGLEVFKTLVLSRNLYVKFCDMEYSDLIHEIILEQVRRKLSRDYKEIGINRAGEKKVEHKGHFPDMVLGNHGMTLALLEVETADSISEKGAAEKWKTLSELGVKLILMVPRDMKVKATELLWAKGIMGNVSMGTYEISVTMP
jgi:hypothetical protein